MEKSLSEIFEEEVRKPPHMAYTKRVRIEYVGKYRIIAMRAVRHVAGLDLKSAKDAIKWSGGLEVSSFMYAGIVETYLADAMHLGAHGSDWREVKERPDPIIL